MFVTELFIKDNMEPALFVHNPEAGKGTLSPAKLRTMISAAGFKCTYYSSKDKDWEEVIPAMDIIIIGGGDGTIKKVILKLLEKDHYSRKPIALLPLGTANNIASTLGISGAIKNIIETWDKPALKKFNIGYINGVNESNYFLEAYGFGLLPRLFRGMKDVDSALIDTPKGEIDFARKLLYTIALDYEAVACDLHINGQDYSGVYLSIEIMNIKSIGPKLYLAPEADPGDDWLDIILIRESQRKVLIDYLSELITGKDIISPFKPIRAQKMRITWNGGDIHIDDEIVNAKKYNQTEVCLRNHYMHFLT